MNKPNLLAKGDTIGIISTARKISGEEVLPAIEKFKSWGLNVELGKNLFEVCDQFAGTDQQRASDLQQMIDDDNIKAIICARGGYGTVRIIDSVDFSNLTRKPKWIIGYSDVTVLHSHLNNKFGLPTIHAVMPINFPLDGTDNSAVNSLRTSLFDGMVEYVFPTSTFNKMGHAEAELVGGNLSILYGLIGSGSDINTSGKILIIEDLDEYLYHIDRMMMNLKRAGKLSNVKALLVGGMTEMNDNTVPFGKSAIEIVSDICATYDIPVAFNFPSGHITDNRAVYLGVNARIDVGQSHSIFTQKY